MDFQHGILLFLMGVPFAILVLYVILTNLDSNYERMDDKDGDNTIWR